ncbi:MAG TPA: four helix bundle protein, partial [Balneolaceae bacterium]|nr:four helix bundle protein [Balneolaceae bacterium]
NSFALLNQVRGAGMSMSNNIAEGSGSNFNKVFRRYLDHAKNSTFENANITILLERRNLIDAVQKEELLENLDHLSRKITNFQKAL